MPLGLDVLERHGVVLDAALAALAELRAQRREDVLVVYGASERSGSGSQSQSRSFAGRRSGQRDCIVLTMATKSATRIQRTTTGMMAPGPPKAIPMKMAGMIKKQKNR